MILNHTYVSALGLLLGMLGAALMWKDWKISSGPAPYDSVMLLENESRYEEVKYQPARRSRFGVLLVFLGFLVQFIALWLHS